jgi:hypothetical protein
VYLIYAIIIVYIDQVAYPNAATLLPPSVFSDDDSTGTGTGTTATTTSSSSSSSGPEFAAYNEAIENINNLFIAAGVIHLVNAFMYIWSWLPLGYTLCSVVMIPEYLNVLGASLYLYTANQYGKMDGTYTDDITFRVHYIETAAASIELVAAFGWATTWYLTFPRRTVGRGWTLDDPDSWGNIFIVVPSIYYIAYNIQILSNPADYCCNDVYKTGDNLYLLGAVFYLIAALRDDGLFRCLPAGGVCSYGCDARTPLDPLGNENAYLSKSARLRVERDGHMPRRYVCGLPPISAWPCFACCLRRGAVEPAFGEGREGPGWCARACSCRRRPEGQSLLRK